MKRLMLWLCLGVVAGCTCSSPGQPGTGGGAGGGGGGGGVGGGVGGGGGGTGGGGGELDPSETERLEDCSVMTGPVDPALVREAVRTLLRADDGTVDLPLRSDGCWRVRRTMSAGVATRLDIVLDLGLVYDPVTFQPRAPIRVTFVHFERDAQGVMTGTVDA